MNNNITLSAVLIMVLCTGQTLAQHMDKNSLAVNNPFVKNNYNGVLSDSQYNHIASRKAAVFNSSNIKVVVISAEATTHFVTNDDIDYVDISSPDLAGEISNKRLFKLKSISPENVGKSYVITLVCNNTITVYKILVADERDVRNSYVVRVTPEDTYQIEESTSVQTKITNKKEYPRLALMAYNKSKKRTSKIKSKSYGIHFFVQNIYVKDDLIFFNLGVKNKTNLQYNLESIRFLIKDRKKVNSSISQDLPIEPLYVFHEFNEQSKPVIKGKYQNTFVLPKFTFPNKKVLHIEMTESGISGRKSDLYVKYKDILAAESLNE